MRLVTIVSILFIGILSSTTLFAQGGFQVSPGKLFFKQQALQQSTQNVLVVNSSQQNMVIRCTFSDWKRDSMGDKKYFPIGTLPHSNAAHLKVVPEIFTLAPGQSKYLEVSMNLPADKDSSYTNAMLLLTQVDEKKAEDKTKKKEAFMKFLLEMGVHIYNEPPQLRYKNVDIESVSYIASKDTVVAFNRRTQRKDTTLVPQRLIKGWIVNNGELIAEGNVRYELTQKTTGQEYKLEPVPFNSMPGDRLLVNRSVPKDILVGKYVLVMLLDIGMDQPLKVGESEIEIN